MSMLQHTLSWRMQFTTEISHKPWALFISWWAYSWNAAWPLCMISMMCMYDSNMIKSTQRSFGDDVWVTCKNQGKVGFITGQSKSAPCQMTWDDTYLLPAWHSFTMHWYHIMTVSATPHEHTLQFRIRVWMAAYRIRVWMAAHRIRVWMAAHRIRVWMAAYRIRVWMAAYRIRVWMAAYWL